jgi:hypothetical protein
MEIRLDDDFGKNIPSHPTGYLFIFTTFKLIKIYKKIKKRKIKL